MAYDIGPKLGIDGFAEFRKSIKAIDEDVKDFRSELKLVAAIYDENGESMEALTAKNEVLQKTYDAQAKKVEETQKILEKVREEYGENADAVRKLQRSLTDSQTALQKTKNAIDKNNKSMDNLEDSTEDVEEAFKDVEDSVKDADKALDIIGDTAKESSGKFDSMKVAAGNLISGGLSAIAGGVANAISSLANLDESTEEYRVAMGKLNTAFESAGYSSEVAKEAYKGLYEILGDTDSATEAAQLMAQLADSEEDMAKWTNIAAGVAGTFGDALPINSLIEAANETAKVGEVTGALADALNWAGINEDEFNEKLAACTSESERNDEIMNTLTETYGDAADAFYKNNEELVKSRENQEKLDEAMGNLGEAVGDVKEDLKAYFIPIISESADEIAEFIASIDTAEIIKRFDEAKTGAEEFCNDVKGFFDGLETFTAGIFDNLGIEWEEDFDSALEYLSNKIVGILDFFTGRNVLKNLFSGIFGDLEQTVAEQGPNVTVSGTRGDNSAYWDSYSSPNSGGNVYLDGKKVGRVLGELNSSEMVAAGADISTLP